MASTELPWTAFHRQVRPFSFGLSLACATLAWTDIIKRNDLGDVLDNGSPEGWTIGTAAALCLLLLWAGFWVRSDRLMRWGLLGAAGVFAARSAFLLADRGWGFTPFWISLSITVMAGGAWLLEKAAARNDQ